MKHKYHCILLFSKHGIVLEHAGYPAEAKTLRLIREDVPETYLSQFWLNTNVETVDKQGLCITGYATHKNADDIVLLSINKAKLRVILGLPSKRDLNLVKYSEEPIDEEICRFVEFRRYNEPLARRTNFRRDRLPSL